MVKTNKKNKKAFSLLEACLVMIIASIFIALTTNVIAHKSKAKTTSEAHGHFECFWDGNTLYQQMFTENSTTGKKTALSAGGGSDYCTFVPPNYAKYVFIYAVGGGAGGNSKTGGGEGQFTSSFYASILPKYYAYPGKGGTVNSVGSDTVIKTRNNTTIVRANGGKTSGSLINTTIDDVLRCVITESTKTDYYNCNIYPFCEVKNGQISVSYCRTKEFYKTTYLTYKETDTSGKTVLNNPRYIVNNIYTKQKPTNPNVWIYHDISLFSDYSTDTNPVYIPNWEPDVNDIWNPSLYTMELLMDMPVLDENETPSNMTRYIESMQYTSKIKDIKPGNGGAKGAKGYPGAVLFLW